MDEEFDISEAVEILFSYGIKVEKYGGGLERVIFGNIVGFFDSEKEIIGLAKFIVGLSINSP